MKPKYQESHPSKVCLASDEAPSPEPFKARVYKNSIIPIVGSTKSILSRRQKQVEVVHFCSLISSKI